MTTANDATPMATIEPPLLVDAVMAARMCSMHRASWYKCVASGRAPAGVRIGGMVRWRKDELEAWIAAGCPVREKWQEMSTAASTASGGRG